MVSNEVTQDEGDKSWPVSILGEEGATLKCTLPAHPHPKACTLLLSGTGDHVPLSAHCTPVCETAVSSPPIPVPSRSAPVSRPST